MPFYPTILLLFMTCYGYGCVFPLLFVASYRVACVLSASSLVPDFCVVCCPVACSGVKFFILVFLCISFILVPYLCLKFSINAWIRVETGFQICCITLSGNAGVLWTFSHIGCFNYTSNARLCHIAGDASMTSCFRSVNNSSFLLYSEISSVSIIVPMMAPILSFRIIKCLTFHFHRWKM